MASDWRRQGLATFLAVTILFAALPTSEGQVNNLLAGLLGGGTSPTPTTPTPTPTVISTTTPSSTPTPQATPAATAAATSTPAAKSTATPAATPTAKSTATPAATPAAKSTATPAAKTTTPTAKATPVAASTKAAASTADAAAPEVAAPTAEPNSALFAVAAPTVSIAPPPPAPIVIDTGSLVPALPADETAAGAPAPATSGSSNSDLTAVDAVLQVAGPGVTPFLIPQQKVLLYAMGSVLTTVSISDLRIRYVTSSANSRRRLLQEPTSMGHRLLLAAAPAASPASQQGMLVNVASVTLEANCSSAAAVTVTLNEIRTVTTNGLLGAAIQQNGEPDWGVTLLSLTAVNPKVPLASTAVCQKKFGGLCLDGSSLSVGSLKAIIAVGAVLLVLLITLPCVYWELRRKSGQMGELQLAPDTPQSPFKRALEHFKGTLKAAKANSPFHRRSSSNGRNAFRPEGGIDKPAEGRGAVQMTATAGP